MINVATKWIVGGIVLVTGAAIGLFATLKKTATVNPLQARIATAIASKNTGELRTIAALLRKGGNETAAASLDAELRSLGAKGHP